MILIQRFSVITLYQHYFLADGERLFGEDLGKLGRSWGKGWGGTVEGDGAMRVESYSIESYGIESGTTKKESLEDFSSKLSHIKEGGHLLSRIALQYHRRRRA